MKRIILIAVFISAIAWAQDTGKYCEIVGMNKFMSSKVVVTVDFGNGEKAEGIKDETGKLKSFRSMIEALNYMNSQGWEFVTAYAITIQNQNVYHYLLKKKSPD